MRIAIIVIFLLLMSVFSAGCDKVGPDPINICKNACSTHSKDLPPGGSCPELTPQPIMNITPSE